MNIRALVLVGALAIALIGFAVFAGSRTEFSTSDIRFFIFFGIFYITLATVAMMVWGKRQVRGLFALPRWLWVAFASLAASFAALMLISIAAMPWVGYKGFELIFSSDFLLLYGTAVLLSPLIAMKLK